MIKYFVIVLFFSSLLLFNRAISQPCAKQMFEVKASYSQPMEMAKTILHNNILTSVGYIYGFLNGKQIKNGVLKFSSPQGKSILVKKFYSSAFNEIEFKDIIPVADSGFFIVGNIAQVSSDGTINANWGLLLHTDVFGNIKWAKKMDNGLNASFQYNNAANIFNLNNQHFLLNTVHVNKADINGNSTTKLIEIDTKGSVIAAYSYQSSLFEFRYNLSKSFIENRNNQWIISGITDVRIKRNDSITRVGYYTIAINKLSKKLEWDNYIEYRNKPSNVFAPVATVRSLFYDSVTNQTQLTCFFDDANLSIPPQTSAAANVKISSKGNLIKASGYSSPTTGSIPCDAVWDDQSNHWLLASDLTSTNLLKISPEGSIASIRSFKNNSTEKQHYQLIKATDGWFYCWNNRLNNVKVTGITKILNDSLFTCSEQTNNFQSTDLTNSFKELPSQIIWNTENEKLDYFSSLSLQTDTINIAENYDCSNVCCNTTINNTGIVNYCEGQAQSLPNGLIINQPGYYFTAQNTANCFSYNLYYAQKQKNPNELSLGSDTCLQEGISSIQLTATPGFNTYYWMNLQSTDSNKLAVSKPGIYFVKVINSCGSKTDSIQIFEKCDFPVLMPNAFTPNNDGINDVFKFNTTLNKNKFIAISIYNRMGQLLFSSNNSNFSWNGKLGSQALLPDTYVYVLTLQAPNGQIKTYSSTVVLLR